MRPDKGSAANPELIKAPAPTDKHCSPPHKYSLLQTMLHTLVWHNKHSLKSADALKLPDGGGLRLKGDAETVTFDSTAGWARAAPSSWDSQKNKVNK